MGHFLAKPHPLQSFLVNGGHVFPPIRLVYIRSVPQCCKQILVLIVKNPKSRCHSTVFNLMLISKKSIMMDFFVEFIELDLKLVGPPV